MHITSRLQDGCGSSNYHRQVQGQKKGEGAEAATSFSHIKKARTLQKLPCSLPLASHWQEMEHMLTTPSLKGRLGSWQSNGRGWDCPDWFCNVMSHPPRLGPLSPWAKSGFYWQKEGKTHSIPTLSYCPYIPCLLDPMDAGKQKTWNCGFTFFFFFFWQGNLNPFEHLSNRYCPTLRISK